MNDQLPSVNILGIHVHTVTQKRLLERISVGLDLHQKILISYANIHAINLAQNMDWLRDFLNTSEICYCDGYGVLLASRILRRRLPARLSTTDWFPHLIKVCRDNHYSIYLLGSRPGITDHLAEVLRSQEPGLNICGVNDGYFDKSSNSISNRNIVESINIAKPDLLVVGMGMPAQERWLLDNWQQLNAGVVLTVGAMFDYLSGATSRAPRWITDHGLEWASRLVTEPGRLWRRYLLGIPVFYWRLFKSMIR